MKLFEKYIIQNYLKNFFVIFIALDLFYVGVDLLTNYNNIPDSANLQILYALFQGMNAVNYVLPLSIVFGMIVTYFGMIKSNELICMYASSISKRSLVKPFFITSLVLTLSYIGLNCTEFAYAYEYSSNLKKYNSISNSAEDLFLKNNNQYIYFKKLDPLKQVAYDVTIFEVDNVDLTKVIRASVATFVDNHWILEHVSITHKPKVSSLDDEGFRIENVEKLKMMENFKPKIMDNVYQSEYALSISDGIDALRFFDNQNVNTSKIKATLFYQLFFPFFAPFLIVVLYYKAPMMGRYFNMALVASSFAFVTLVVWSGLFLLSRLAANGVILSEIAILFPIILLVGIAAYFYSKR
ncbi:LptF/LptG family permease [Sulfurospirillum diekertiae]|uniref:Permease n=1 Tax=Sulfurospirillum diekertiae TaxID=1854492 RepID=A0A290HSL5_9BACT|nr:LptF/LptG family permease [Sulfurospirillum diekertiae]ATB68379.1 putative permease [Sulfurospirillum diekertiae]QIR76235.1 LptF/LptG family permease [Sulfurospirillum diekertiae]QIR78865.1 LptF/LptG family permease [Sulfurospirillum diekertiae]